MRLTTLLAEMGVHDIRLTGGEPLVRRDFPTLAGMLAEVPGVEDLSVTTNGYLLERDAERARARRGSTASTSRSTRSSATASSR